MIDATWIVVNVANVTALYISVLFIELSIRVNIPLIISKNILEIGNCSDNVDVIICLWTL